MKPKENRNLVVFLAESLRLHKEDFWQMPAVVLCIFAFIEGILLIVLLVGGEHEPLEMGVAGLIALLGAGMLNGVQSMTRFSSEFRLGIHMSIPRRRMLLSGLTLALANGAEMIGTAALLQGLNVLLFGRGPASDNLMAAFPLWGWAALLYFPVAAGILAGAILMRFGRIGFWVLYGVFMAACLGPQTFGHGISGASWEALLTVLPMALPLGAAVCAGAGAALLWRVPVSE